MYPKLPLKFIGITDTFGMRKHPITGVSTFHYGLDLGWNKYQGEPVYASYDAKIVDVGYDSSLGNYVVLKYNIDKKTIINRYLHLKNRSLVKKGSKVKQGEILGYMGETGSSTAVHLHFEYWICPNIYSYRGSDYVKYAVDPLEHCYLFENQEVSKSSSSKVRRVVGTPVKENKDRNQLKVFEKYLNCRSTPMISGKKLGFTRLGYYNILDKKVNDGYTWYKIGTNKWIAYLKSAVVIYLVNNNQINTSKETNNDIGKVTNINDVNKGKDEKQDKENDNSVNDTIKEETKVLSNFNEFTSPNDDYYYIYLGKGETIYYPKYKIKP